MDKFVILNVFSQNRNSFIQKTWLLQEKIYIAKKLVIVSWRHLKLNICHFHTFLTYYIFTYMSPFTVTQTKGSFIIFGGL